MTIVDRTRLIAAMIDRGHSPISAYNEANGPNAEKYFIEYLGPKTMEVHDIFIGNYPVTQKFANDLIINGVHIYHRYGWKGHNGIDFGMKIGTQLISCVNGVVIAARNDPKGWGNYIYIYDESQHIMVIYAHLSKLSVRTGQKVTIGKGIGLSGNTGSSTGPHLHFGIYKTNNSGYKINLGNGYGGAINPFDSKVVTWVISNPSKPL